jgi:hypothetical protein
MWANCARLWLRGLLQAWRERRLSLSGLSREERIVAIACLLVVAVECGLLLAKAFGVTPAGGAEVIPSAGRASRVAIVFVYLGLAAASAAVALAARAWPQSRFRVVLLLLALPVLSLAAQTVLDARLERDLTRAGFFGGTNWWLTLTLAIVAAVASSISLAVIGLRATCRPAAIVGALTVPFLLCLAAYAVASSRAAPLDTDPRFAALPDSPRATIALAPANMAAVAGLLLSVVLLWQAAAGARAIVRDAGERVERLARLFPFAIVAALAVKVLWLLLGYLGWLPNVVGGGGGFWVASRDAGWGWLLAGLYVVLLFVWLSRQRRFEISDRDVSRAAIFAVVGFSALFAAALILLFVASIWQGFWPGKGASAPGQASLVSAIGWLGDQQRNWQALYVFLAGTAALALLRLRRAYAIAVLLAAFVIWAAPRAIVVGLEESHVIHRSEHSSVFVDRVTLDTIVTGVVAALLVWSLVARRVVALPLALIVAVSTLLAYGGRLTAALTGSHARLFYLGLIFPVIWSFGFDAAGLNERGPGRSRKVLTATGLAAGGLALLGLKISTGAVAPGHARGAESANILFVIPFAVALIATSIAVGVQPRTPQTAEEL